MNRLWSLACGATLVLGAASSGYAQEEGSLAVMFFGGTQNTPTDFDVFRSVEYDAGILVGGGLVFGIDEYVAVRGSFGYAGNSGQETGVLAGESIDFSRRYYSAELQIRYPLQSITPYLLGGGGVVTLSRESPSYSYDMTEGAAVFGAGASYRIGENLDLFAEGKGWFYPRQTVGETQFDKVVNVGLTYTLRL